MNIDAIPQYHSFIDWLGDIVDHKNQHEIEFFCICAWQIQCTRNEYCFDKICAAPELFYKRAWDILVEYTKANALNERIKNQTENVKQGSSTDRFPKS